MKIKSALFGAAAAVARAMVGCQTQRAGIAPSPVAEGDDIVGVVTGSKGPEAGVWVIAETQDLPTRYAGSAEASYYVWVDRFNVLGLGAGVPIAMGNGSDSIMPFVDGKFVTLRLPYPSGLFPKNVDGRIDDESAGWKGRALWTTSGTRTNFHLEGAKENRPKAIKLQLRPDPLAR